MRERTTSSSTTARCSASVREPKGVVRPDRDLRHGARRCGAAGRGASTILDGGSRRAEVALGKGRVYLFGPRRSCTARSRTARSSCCSTRPARCQARAARSQPAPRRLDRQALRQPRPVAPRPDPGRQHRADEGGRSLPVPARLQVLDLRDLVDPPGDRPRGGRLRPHHPAARARHRIAHQAERERRTLAAELGRDPRPDGAGQAPGHEGRPRSQLLLEAARTPARSKRRRRRRRDPPRGPRQGHRRRSRPKKRRCAASWPARSSGPWRR
jgi:hypothetical protein